MATQNTSVTPKSPVQNPPINPVKALTVKEMADKVEKHYDELGIKKRLSLTDLNSQSDFANLQRDAEQHKVGLKEWHKYLEQK